MKFAKCKYATFENGRISLKLVAGDIFVVTDEIEALPEYQDGLRIGSFEIVDAPTSVTELKKVIGYKFGMAVEAEPAKEPEQIADEVTEEVVDDAEQEEEVEEEAEPEEDAVAFTELAKSWQEAVKMVKKETDVAKLNHALKNDERKSVRKAINERLKELSKE